MLRLCRRAASRSSRRVHAAHHAALSSASQQQPWPSHRASSEVEDRREVGVFWDMENCAVPSSSDPFLVRPNLERALRTCGFLGPIGVAGYANINNISRGHTLEALSESGISIRHVPSSSRDASDRALLIDVMFWTMKHAPPAHILLITGDTDFSVLMHKLWSLGYNVLLATPHRVSPCLLHAASKIWMWPDVIIGEPLGQIAVSHTPGTPLPETLVGKIKDFGASKRIEEDNSKTSGKMKFQEESWLTPYAVDRIVNIVKGRPGIALRDLIKELKAIDISPKNYGHHDFYYCFSRIDQLETQFIEGLGMKDGVIFNVANHASIKKCSATASSNEASSKQDKNVDHRKASDGNVHVPWQKWWGSWLFQSFKGR